MTLRLPPLRERAEDIPPLVDHFLARYGNRHSITRECLDGMLSYHWPGNVRELENAIQRMVAVNSGPLLHTADLPSQVMTHLEGRKAERFSLRAAAAQGGDVEIGASVGVASCAQPAVLSISEAEKRAIRQALAYTKGDRATTAHLLGIGRTTLYRKIKEYGLTD